MISIRLHTVGVSMERRNAKSWSVSVSAIGAVPPGCPCLLVISALRTMQADPLGYSAQGAGEVDELRQLLGIIQSGRVEVLALEPNERSGVKADRPVERRNAPAELLHDGAQEGGILAADLQHVLAGH